MLRDRRDWGQVLQAAAYGIVLLAVPPTPAVTAWFYMATSATALVLGRRLSTR